MFSVATNRHEMVVPSCLSRCEQRKYLPWIKTIMPKCVQGHLWLVQHTSRMHRCTTKPTSLLSSLSKTQCPELTSPQLCARQPQFLLGLVLSAGELPSGLHWITRIPDCPCHNNKQGLGARLLCRWKGQRVSAGVTTCLPSYSRQARKGLIRALKSLPLISCWKASMMELEVRQLKAAGGSTAAQAGLRTLHTLTES